MNAMNDNIGTPVARGLNVLIIIAMIFIAIVVALLILCGFILMTDNAMSADITEKLANSGKNMAAQMYAVSFFGAAVIGAIWFFVLRILRKVVKTLLSGDPFVPDNISRLRMIWIVIALAEILRIVMANLAMQGEITLDLRPGTWFVVFVIAALAEVFRHGAELRRDAELTI